MLPPTTIRKRKAVEEELPSNIAAMLAAARAGQGENAFKKPSTPHPRKKHTDEPLSANIAAMLAAARAGQGEKAFMKR